MIVVLSTRKEGPLAWSKSVNYVKDERVFEIWPSQDVLDSSIRLQIDGTRGLID